jgi:tetratricopeptide (TPR) repeat protein
MRRSMKLMLTLWFALFLGQAGAAADDDEDVDYLALAALMLRDGNLDRALLALDQVDLHADGAVLARYYTLRGMTHVRRNEHELARDALRQAIASGAADAVVHVYLAQSQFQLEDYGGAIAAQDSAGAAIERIPSIYHMRAQCYWLLDDPVGALATLDQAAGIFVEDASFLRRKVFYLVDLGLFQQAAVLGREYLQRSEGKLEDYVALGNALRASGELDEAALLLEQALLQFPGSADVRKVLAHVYIDRSRLSAAADVLYEAALIEPALLAEAAELYRRSGQAYRALTLNSQLSDQPEKFRQRLALYLQVGHFEQAAAMETPLRRVGLLEDQDIRYAVAYALFKTGDFEAAEGHLAELDRADLFRKAAELRRVIGDCTAERWKCL